MRFLFKLMLAVLLIGTAVQQDWFAALAQVAGVAAPAARGWLDHGVAEPWRSMALAVGSLGVFLLAVIVLVVVINAVRRVINAVNEMFV